MSAANVRRPRAAVLSLAMAVALGGSFAPGLVFADAGQAAAPVQIAYQEFTLPNGLTVIVHEDHKAPIVAVNIWYGVGSKNEPAGRSGFAHLFEHLMFNGSENPPGAAFQQFAQAGAPTTHGTPNGQKGTK